MLIFLFGSGTLALYQVMAMEDQLDAVTQAVDQMDGKVKRAQYEKAKFYALAKDVLRLAPKDPNAAQVAAYYKFKELQAAQPALMDLSAPPDAAMATTSAAQAQLTAATNSAPVLPSQATNAAPLPSPSPTAK
jgi:hypothetical protein